MAMPASSGGVADQQLNYFSIRHHEFNLVTNSTARHPLSGSRASPVNHWNL